MPATTTAALFKRMLTAPTFGAFLKAKYIDSYAHGFLAGAAPRAEDICTFEEARDIAAWRLSTNDPDPITGADETCSLTWDAATACAIVKGVVKPTLPADDDTFMFGFAHVRTHAPTFLWQQMNSVIDLSGSAKFEIVYFTPPAAKTPPGIERMSSFIFNVYVAPGMLSLPFLFQLPLELRGGWQRCIVPYGAFKQVRQTAAFHLRQSFDAGAVCGFGLNFVARDSPAAFEMWLRRIRALPDVDEAGNVDAHFDASNLPASPPVQMPLASLQELQMTPEQELQLLKSHRSLSAQSAPFETQR